jgi:hypothetical protein
MRAKEFIDESRKPLRKSTQQSLPNLSVAPALDNNNHPYLAYRFGLALAASPDLEKFEDEGPLGSNFTMIDYSDGDEEIRKAAAKRMGIKFERGTGKGSEELPDSIINKHSPVAVPKKNRYGV